MTPQEMDAEALVWATLAISHATLAVDADASVGLARYHLGEAQKAQEMAKALLKSADETRIERLANG